MRAVEEMVGLDQPQSGGSTLILELAPVFDSDRAALALSNFLEEARGILERIDASHGKDQETRPVVRARRDVLRFLSRSHGKVEFHDLPILASLGKGLGRSLIESMVQQGLVDLARDQTYPNMAYLRITPAGIEELRTIGVREAMSWLHGADRELGRAIGGARDALNQLLEAIAA